MARSFRAVALALALAGLALTGCRGARPAASEKTAPEAIERVRFEGKWDGKYESDQGQTGEGKYEFHAEKDGRWEVTVTWDRDTQRMKLAGERLGPDAVRLEGKHEDTTYWYIGRTEGGVLVLRYLSVEGKTGKSGTGVSRLTRPK